MQKDKQLTPAIKVRPIYLTSTSLKNKTCHAGERGPKRDLTETEFINVQNGITEIL
jgi:hypothetical protein